MTRTPTPESSSCQRWTLGRHSWRHLSEGGFEAQARLALDNLVEVLKAAGGGLEDLMMITVFVTDMGNRPIFARVRDAYFRANPPASTIVQITRLFMEGVLVEVNGVAVLD